MSCDDGASWGLKLEPDAKTFESPNDGMESDPKFDPKDPPKSFDEEGWNSDMEAAN